MAVSVKILGDAASLALALAKMRDSVSMTEQQIAGKAQLVVEKSAIEREQLRKLADDYLAIATAAEKGSDRQVAAAEKAGAAYRRLGMETAPLEAQLKRLGASHEAVAAAAGRQSKAVGDAEKTARGAIGTFTGLGKAMFYASNAFLGGVVGASIAKDVYDAAKAYNTAFAALRNDVKDTGASWAVYGGQIEKVLAQQQKLSGFTKTDLTTALGRLVLSTGSVAKAEDELTVSTNLARAAHEDLATAEKQVALAASGRLTTIRGLQLSIPKVTTAEDQLKQKLAELKAEHDVVSKSAVQQATALAKAQDQAATAAKVMDILRQKTQGADQQFSKTSEGALAHLKSSIDDIEVSIGNEFLPDIDKLIKKADDWVTKMDATGQAQRDAKNALNDLVGVVRTGKQVIQGIDDVTGGFKHTLELLLGLKMVGIVSGWVTSFGKLASTIGAAGEAGTAEGAASGLLATLTKLKLLGPIAITLAVNEAITEKQRSNAIAAMGATPVIGNTLLGHHVGDKPFAWNGTQGSLKTINGTTYFVPTAATGKNMLNPANLKGALSVGGGPTSGGGRLSQLAVEKLLLQNGVPPAVAANLAKISAQGEDPSGDATRLNNTPSTGDYSIGLFQENFDNYTASGKFTGMGTSRVAQYAPQFGLSPKMPVAAFVQWLGAHPDAQAQIAYQIYQSQGYGAWKTAAGLGITGGSVDSALTGGTHKNPAWLAAQQRAAAALSNSRASAKQSLSGIQQNIGGLQGGIKTTLETRANAIAAAIGGASKSAIPGIRRDLAELRTEVSHGLAQAVDDRKITAIGKTLQDDLDHKLLTPEQFRSLAETIGRYNAELTDGLLAAPARKKIEANLSDLKAQLKLDLALDSDRKQLAGAVSELNHDVTLGLFPSAVAATARRQAAALGKQIADGTTAALPEIKSALKSLGSTIKEGVADATAIRNYDQALSSFGAGLVDKLNQTLGVPATYASQSDLVAAEQAGAQITARLAKGATGTAKTQLENALTQNQKTIESALNGMLNQVQSAKSAYETAWSRLAAAGDQAFDQQTQDTVQKMQDDLTNAINKMQITVSGSGFNSFLYGGDITQTPAEAALAALQEQQNKAQLQKQLADDQKNLANVEGANRIYDVATGATRLISNSQDVIDAQQKVADDQVAIQEDALQQTANLERKAADKQLQDAQTAAQQQGQAKITAYQQQRADLKTALDDQVADIQTAFEQGNITAQTAFDELTGLYKQNGVDVSQLSVVIAGNIYDGVSKWTDPIMGLMDDLQKKIAETNAAIASATGIDTSNAIGGSPDLISEHGAGQNSSTVAAAVAAAVGTTTSSGGTSYYQSNTGSYGKKPMLAAGAIVRHRPGGLDVTVGEGGVDEAVIPLTNQHLQALATGKMPLSSRTLSGGGGAISGSTGGDLHVHLHVGTVIGSDLDKAAKDLVPPLRRELLRVKGRNRTLGLD